MSPNKWDLYFLRLAREVSKNSKCLSRKIGAVLVKDKAVISTGYNGAPRGARNCDERLLNWYVIMNGINGNTPHKVFVDELPEKCPRRYFGYESGQGLHLCQAGHAERNALIQAARNGISTLGTTLYCYCPIPCKDCMIEIINAGVTRLVFLKGSEYDGYSKVLLEESNIAHYTYKEELL